MTGDRLKRMRVARELITELQAEVDQEEPRSVQAIESARNNLARAGRSIQGPSFDNHMEEALGEVAGLAIATEHDRLADRATRVLDDAIEFQSEPLTEVEKETDDRGRVTLGSDWADQTVRVAVLDTEQTD